MSMPLPPQSSDNNSLGNVTESSDMLNVDEQTLILDATLKDKHRNDEKCILFIESFVRCRNIRQASNEAGVRPDVGYKYRHSKDVASAIQKITDKAIMKYGFDGEEIVERVKEVVDFDPIDLVNPDGTYKESLAEIPAEARRVIKKFKAKNLYDKIEDINGMKKTIIVGKLIEVEFYDKLKGAELLGSEKGQFKKTTRVEHALSDNMAEHLLESKRLADKTVTVINSDGSRVE